MFHDDNLQTFKLGNRMVITDPAEKICFSVNAEYFKKCDLSDTDNPISKVLMEQRLIHKSNGTGTNKIHSVYLFVTRECNLSCTFCSMRSNVKTTDAYKQKLTLEQIKKDVIPFLKVVNPHRLIVSGGEPFTNANIYSILNTIRESFPLSDISVQTNGLLLSEQLIQTIEKVVSRVEISTAHFEGRFDRLENILSTLKRYKIDCALSFVYNQNMDNLKQVVDLTAKYHANFLLNFISPDGSALDSNTPIMSSEEKLFVYEHVAQYILNKGYNNKKFADVFFQPVRAKLGCGALGSTIVIFPNGNMYPCHSLEIPELRIGNITDDPLKLKTRMKEINYSKLSQSLFNVKLKEPCQECRLRFICGGFCGANLYNGIHCDCDLQKVLIIFDLLAFDSNKTFLENLANFVDYIENRKYNAYLSN